jgi:hypothetical protein
VLGSAAVSAFSNSALDARQSTPGGLKIKFVGMMGYISRSDGSMLVAMPGHHPSGHYGHVPFLMARAGSAVATALGMTAMPGVQPGAFDVDLVNATAGSFVYRCLDGTDIDIDSDGTGAVINNATQLAQMTTIAKGKRLRNDLRRWSAATLTLRGGRLDNSAAHPDAGKIWTFGSHRQPLTDATLFTTNSATVRLSAGARVLSYTAGAAETAELWVVSSTGPRTDIPDPKRLEHGAILFAYFADAEPVVATCEEAEGRITLATEIPCGSGTATTSRVAGTELPPYAELCYGGGWCGDCI